MIGRFSRLDPGRSSIWPLLAWESQHWTSNMRCLPPANLKAPLNLKSKTSTRSMSCLMRSLAMVALPKLEKCAQRLTISCTQLRYPWATATKRTKDCWMRRLFVVAFGTSFWSCWLTWSGTLMDETTWSWSSWTVATWRNSFSAVTLRSIGTARNHAGTSSTASPRA